jgi:hypothetical protein
MDDDSSLGKELWSPEEDKYDDDDDDDEALNHETFGDDDGEGMKSILFRIRIILYLQIQYTF